MLWIDVSLYKFGVIKFYAKRLNGWIYLIHRILIKSFSIQVFHSFSVGLWDHLVFFCFAFWNVVAFAEAFCLECDNIVVMAAAYSLCFLFIRFSILFFRFSQMYFDMETQTFMYGIRNDRKMNRHFHILTSQVLYLSSSFAQCSRWKAFHFYCKHKRILE